MMGAKFGLFLDTNLTFQFVQFGQGLSKQSEKRVIKHSVYMTPTVLERSFGRPY